MSSPVQFSSSTIHFAWSLPPLLSLASLCAMPQSISPPTMTVFSTSAFSAAGGVRFGPSTINSTNIGTLDARRSKIPCLRKSKLSDQRQKLLSVRSKYSDDGYNSGGDFVAGFLLGGAIFGTLAYVFAPQIRRSLLNENEDGFQRPRKPNYYNEGLEMTQHTLNEKISQLNSAIDKVSSRLRGGNKEALESTEAESELESTM